MTSATKAAGKLQLSSLLNQTQLLMNDLELSSLNLALKGSASTSIVESVTDGEISRTIEGASTVTITLYDRDRTILRSGRLAKGCDIHIDGLWFRLMGVEKTGDQLTLTFEDREVAILRTYMSFIKVARNSISRARFIKRMIDEVKEFKIPFVCPEIDKVQPKPILTTGSAPGQGEVQWARDPGFAPWLPTGGVAKLRDITVKSRVATPEQLANTDRVLRVGASRGAPWVCMVAAIEVINEESSARNLNYSGDGLSAGIFQQRYHKDGHRWWGSFEEVQNIEYASNKFFDGAIAAFKKNPAIQPEFVALEAQVAGNQEDRIIPIWRRFREEAMRTVAAWGVDKGTTSALASTPSTKEARDAQNKDNKQAPTNDDLLQQFKNLPNSEGRSDAANKFEFSRGNYSVVDGRPVTKLESSWVCSGRLADEVGWRRFMVSGTFYYMSEPYLFKSKPYMRITEDTVGVISIDGSYMTQQKNATVTITAHMGWWEAPPGSMIEIVECGLISGRWLVTEISRNLFDPVVTINCKKPRPILPEPALDAELSLTFDPILRPNTAGDTFFPTPPSTTPLAPGTNFVAGDRGEILAALRDHINSKQLTFNPGNANDRNGLMLSGSILRKDGVLVEIDTDVIKFLVWACNHYTIRAWSIVGGHSQFVAGGGNESRHWTGHAVDIDNISGKNVEDPSARDAVMAFMNSVKSISPLNGNVIIPNQMICNGAGHVDPVVKALQLNNKIPTSFVTDDDHTNHVHIGY